jgi:K+-sensing histidine kinase KdpD
VTRWVPVLSNVTMKENLKADVRSCFEKAISYFPDINKEIINNCQPIPVKIPSSLLIHFFYELIDNSLKHGGKKLSKIIIDCKRKEDKLYLKYQDDGVGITNEKRNKIFFEDMTKNHALYLMKEAMNILGGDIEEKGEEGQGVKFIISVPIS